MEWTSTSAKVHKTFHGLQRGRDAVGKEEEEEDRITASIAAGLSNMPEENQVRNRPPHEEVPHEKMRLRFHGEDMVSTENNRLNSFHDASTADVTPFFTTKYYRVYEHLIVPAYL